jgi:hypothetical protein
MKPHIRLRATADGFASDKSSRTAYDGASLTARDVRAWTPPRRSADAEILPSLDTLVARARDIDRNNPIAKGARTTIVDNVVGTGPRLSPQPDYRLLGKTKEWADEWSAKMQGLFHSWWWTTKCHAGDTLTGDQLAQQALAAVIMNGDTIALPLWLPERGDGYATKLQMIEADRLSNPNGQGDTQFMRAGVKLDEYGAPLGYWIRTTHPGDFLVAGMQSFGKWEFVPRKTDYGRLRAIHYFDAERSPQTRGKPLLTTILPQLKNIDRYIRAEIDAAVANAMIAGIITTPLDHESIVQLFSKDHQAYLKARSENAVSLGKRHDRHAVPWRRLHVAYPGPPQLGIRPIRREHLPDRGCGRGPELRAPDEGLLEDDVHVWADVVARGLARIQSASRLVRHALARSDLLLDRRGARRPGADRGRGLRGSDPSIRVSALQVDLPGSRLGGPSKGGDRRTDSRGEPLFYARGRVRAAGPLLAGCARSARCRRSVRDADWAGAHRPSKCAREFWWNE